MEDEGWLNLGVAGALAKEYAAHQRRFLDSLARLLEGALPGQVEVRRGGGLLSRERPVTEVTVHLGEHRYVLQAPRHGGLSGRRSLLKRGIVLRTDELPVETWIAEVGAALEEHAHRNEAAATALRRFLG